MAKVIQDKVAPFQPVTITLETAEELSIVRSLFGQADCNTAPCFLEEVYNRLLTLDDNIESRFRGLLHYCGSDQ